MANVLIICGKMEQKLKDVPDNTYHSLVTDAPFGFGEEPDILEVMRDWIEKGYHKVKNRSGMAQKEWDAFVPDPIQWKEAYRTMRPGAYGLVACGTRTQDWMVASLRFAGFEIRDIIAHHHSQGFPKSLNISAAIDEYLGEERPKETKMVGDISNANFVGKEKSPRVEREVSKDEPQTDEAKRFHGYGLQLKPSTELWTLIRKPLERGLTVAENILKWGTGGLNIGACKIAGTVTTNPLVRNAQGYGSDGLVQGAIENGSVVSYGRWPANLILDESTVEIMNQQTGIKKSGAMKKPYVYINNGTTFGTPSGETKSIHDNEEGYVSRFFYCAKPSRSEKNKGLEAAHFKSMIKMDDYNAIDDIPKNTHISVKSVSLMRYFVRLVTPTGGVCLDCFAGSGTTGIACKLEDFDCVLIEMEQDKCEIARYRIDAWEPEPDIPPQLDLFA
jgi:site-specific DNA-methyltransferase (adenine-specific)